MRALRSSSVAAVFRFAGLIAACATALAQDANGRATIAVVGDADRFNIGQDGYCGRRSEIELPSEKSFRIPAGKPTVFFIRSKFEMVGMTFICEGDFSFLPEPGLLHVVRFTMIAGNQCSLEMFRSRPGETPSRMSFVQEKVRACLNK